MFYAFAAVTVIGSLLVVSQKNPVYSVLSIILAFFGLAGLYVLLEAPFVAVVQIIIYAGAIMVLFLRKNLITLLLSIEIMLNAVNLAFVAFGRQLGTNDGQIITFFVMTVAAAEAAVGLALVIGLFRHRESLHPQAFTALKWLPRAVADSSLPARR